MKTIKVMIVGESGSGMTTVADVIRQAMEMADFRCDVSPEVQRGLDDLPSGSFDERCYEVSCKTKVLIGESRSMPQARRKPK